MGNGFRHQVYSNARPQAAYRLLRPDPGPDVGTAEFRRRMRDVGDAFRAAGVSTVFLVHGTFVGGDAGGLWTELSRTLPAFGSVLREITKKWTDTLVGESGNYTDQFARLFEQTINRADRPRIPVRLFHWTSENHHIGRAHAAVRLLDELDRLPDPGRPLLWGHSHAGNVFALLTNLLAGDEATVDEFFNSAQVFFQQPVTQRVDLPVWQTVRQRLGNSDRPLAERQCDFVTFGTPIRYGWDTRGFSGLLHFVNHRPVEGVPDYLAGFPPTAEDVLKAAEGDYVQQIGIAGTNAPPNVLAWRALLADRRLNKLLQPGLRARDLYERLKLGMRVPEQGTTLLCNYGPPQVSIARHLAGHAVYTQPEWLLFHAEQTVDSLYASQGP
ncbi:MAG: hypothetical protein ACE5KM_02395 [Planctomycetaceae bacterium]